MYKLLTEHHFYELLRWIFTETMVIPYTKNLLRAGVVLG